MDKKRENKTLICDILYAVTAGLIVGIGYFFFQNSNGFAPGGVTGLATITHYLIGGKINWSILMICFNLPIFILLSVFVNKKLGLMLIIYLVVQSFVPDLLEILGAKAYCLANNAEDFSIVFACIATGVISGFGSSIMLKRFGASGGTYGIAALIRKKHPELNMAQFTLIIDACVVSIAFFVYGMRITPVICTLLNLYIASQIVEKGLSGLKIGYKFEIVTAHPAELSKELIEKLKHGVTQINVHGVYSNTDKTMLVCIINKRQIGEMMKIIKNYPDTFASYEKVSEVFGNFARNV